MEKSSQQTNPDAQQWAQLRAENEQLKAQLLKCSQQCEEALARLAQLEADRQQLPYAYKYPHPAVAADCIVFGYDGQDLKLLLIQRGGNPYKGSWAFPGGFLEMANGCRETLEECALRELKEETGFAQVDFIEQLQMFSDADRDPRDRVLSAAFLALVKIGSVQGSDDAAQAQWFRLQDVPENLAFDHAMILNIALKKLRDLMRSQPMGLQVLPDTFTMPELRHFYEAVVGTPLSPSRFAQQISALGLLEEETELRPANSESVRYRFNTQNYDKLKQKHFYLDF